MAAVVAAGCVAARQQAVPACGAAGTSGIVSRSRVAGRRRWRRRVGGGGVIHSMCTVTPKNAAQPSGREVQGFFLGSSSSGSGSGGRYAFGEVQHGSARGRPY